MRSVSSSPRVPYSLESLQRHTRRGRRDQRGLRSQFPGVGLQGIDEDRTREGPARLVPVFFGRSNIAMHSGDGDTEHVYDVTGQPCIWRSSWSCLWLLRDTGRRYGTFVVTRTSRRNDKALKGLVVSFAIMANWATKQSCMSCVCWQNVAETWRYSQRQVPMLRQVQSTTEIHSCTLLRCSCLLRHCQGPTVQRTSGIPQVRVRFIAHFDYESHSLSMLPYISNFLKINNFKVRKI